ncbi:PID-CTERM protein-sorting domain-containing protein [Mariniflexile sp. AS56]|uniref:PID-CTERM protein-sorting domain-containing protein n=1 Tax=Mariniflexile sp. AS56 TaxID=3063957 RepID=UPI0026EA7F64|nr:hypothetical protein [Mariniflexile sp. AS56]MDO7171990.1 hypothetical protein [Mariniflexile sp. AS56]
MKNSKNTLIKTLKVMVVIIAFICTTNIQAQGIAGPPNLGGQSDNNVQDNPDSIPLDGGLAILLAGAAAFGIKKLRNKKEQ